MGKLLKKKTLVLVFILGLAVRFYQLGQIPSAMNRDEPAIGYNAYSILKTGRDEWGEKFPLSFKSFGDYKSPLYIYLTVIPVAIFGLNEFSVRFWAGLSGSLTVLVIYFLAKGLFSRIVRRNPIQDRFALDDPGSMGLLAAFLLAISPWHIFFSRFSFEAILALFFNFFALYLLVKNDFKKVNLSIILLILLSLFSYSSSLLIWPLFIFLILVLNFKAIFSKPGKNKSFNLNSLWMILLLGCLGLVLYYQLSLSSQKNKVTIFGDPLTTLNYYHQRESSNLSSPLLISLFHNKYLYYAKIILVNYFKTFSFNFLFGGGGSHPWHKIPQMPHLYPIYLFLSVIGLIVFIKDKKVARPNKIFLLLFLLISPLASAITVDTPHATRLLHLFFLITFFSALGLGFLWQKRKEIVWLALLWLILRFGQYNYLYFIKYKQNPPPNILPGLKKAILSLQQLEEKQRVERIIFTNHTDGAYIYLLFYTQYPPAKFQKQVKRYTPDAAGLEWVEKFDQYLFISCPQPDSDYREIYLMNGDDNLSQKTLKTIENPNTDKIEYTVSANF